MLKTREFSPGCHESICSERQQQVPPLIAAVTSHSLHAPARCTYAHRTCVFISDSSHHCRPARRRHVNNPSDKRQHWTPARNVCLMQRLHLRRDYDSTAAQRRASNESCTNVAVVISPRQLHGVRNSSSCTLTCLRKKILAVTICTSIIPEYRSRCIIMPHPRRAGH